MLDHSNNILPLGRYWICRLCTGREEEVPLPSPFSAIALHEVQITTVKQDIYKHYFRQ
jgi:hypothetical protein